MSEFRKKPVVVEAVQLDPTGAHRFKLPEGVTGRQGAGADNWGYDGCTFWVDTLAGRMEAKPFDWIITGVKGERYPCKPDIFETIYEAVQEPPQ
jgi:hypothetical protein